MKIHHFVEKLCCPKYIYFNLFLTFFRMLVKSPPPLSVTPKIVGACFVRPRHIVLVWSQVQALLPSRMAVTAGIGVTAREIVKLNQRLRSDTP